MNDNKQMTTDRQYVSTTQIEITTLATSDLSQPGDAEHMNMFTIVSL